MFGTLAWAETVDFAPTPDAVRGADLAVPFEPNAGQFDPAVAFAARTFAGTLFVTRDGQLVHALAGPRLTPRSAHSLAREKITGGWTLVETLIGAARLRPHGDEVTPTRLSRFIGNDPARWRSDLATYRQVRLGEVWPGITVDVVARGNNVEKLFTVAPGANPEHIRVKVRGARQLHLSADGALIVETGDAPLTFTPPLAYQLIEGTRHPVAVRYRLAQASTYRFQLGVYDASAAVIIDPLLQATYLGGSGDDLALAIAVSGGNVYVAGGTYSTDFPGTAGGYQMSHASDGGGEDVFVAKLSGDLRTLTQATYLGGTGPGPSEVAYAIAVDGNGNVFVAGVTACTDFPGTSGGAQASNGSGGDDAFVAKLTGDLQTLTQATYLGGSNGAAAFAMALAAGNVYVAGPTESSDFPGTAGGYQASLSGTGDAFVAKLTGDLKTLTQATYLGGSGGENALGLLANGGNIYVVGVTGSTDFPGTLGGAQPSLAGSGDAFVAELAGDLKTLTQATYLGGSGGDTAYGVALDGSGNVYIAGLTFSSDFPGTAGGAQPSYGGSGDAFVAKLSANLQTLVQATYLGGSGAETGVLAHLALDANGNVYVAGFTTSTDFPGTAGGVQAAHASDGGLDDAFVAKLAANLQSLTQATYLGGNGTDRAYALALDGSGNVYVTGFTGSSNFPGTKGGAQPNNAGLTDAFVAKLSADLRASPNAPIPALQPWELLLLVVLLAACAVRAWARFRVPN